MGDIDKVQEQMKADMEALKDQVTSMMKAMLSMKRMMESNATTIVTAEADPTHPCAINQAYQPIPTWWDKEKMLSSTDSPHMGHNRNAYPCGLPPNYMPPTMNMPNENANHAAPVTFKGQQP